MDYKSIELENETMKPHIVPTLTKLENALIKGRDRDNDKIPIYLTKWRIKSSQSIYLKLKRKPTSKITDRGGMRVLCLFEQDILPTFEFIIITISELRYKLKEIIIYNWESEEDILTFKQIMKQKFKHGADFKNKSRRSGYKSVHFTATSNIDDQNYYIEIQLRTLLQDVWGELEHSLAYKQGNIHPHIKKSFSLLANDLQTSDKLIAHLRDISDKEKNIAEFMCEDKPPTAVFAYEDDLVADLFKDDERKKLLDRYDEHINEHWKDNNTHWVNTAESLFNKIKRNFDSSDDLSEEHALKIKYWIDIEDAFLLLSKRDYKPALKAYNDIAEHNKDRYVPQFRIGEIQLIHGNVEESLAAFDECERLLNAETGSDGAANKFNVYLVKSILANVYWKLGEEFVPLAVDEICEAESINRKNTNLLEPEQKAALTNNICYYLLEDYILTLRNSEELTSSAKTAKEKKDAIEAKKKCEQKFATLKKRFDDLESMIKKAKFDTANAYDTAAWFCYHAYLRYECDDWLDKAYSYCKESWRKGSKEGDLIYSVNVRRMHTQEIRTAKYAKRYIIDNTE